MKNRSYQQYCPIAYGLDVIGQRWTLLLVRELGLGPRRFTDLQRGLPTMGSNLLSDRLKALEASGVVTSIPLPPPARVTAYQLTAVGWSLAAAMQPLVRWGLQFMPETVPEEDFVGAIPVMLALKLMFQPTLGEGEHLLAEIELKPDVFRVALKANQIRIEQEYAPEAPLALETSPKAILNLVQNGYSPTAFTEEVDVTIKQGDSTLVNHFFAQFSMLDVR